MPVSTSSGRAPAAPPDPSCSSLLVQHDPASVSGARHALVADLRRDPVTTGVADEAAVVASELLGNAVRHAQPLDDGGVLLRWHVRPGEVEIEVVDGGGSAGGPGGGPAARDAEVTATGGRGLRIVEVLSQRWGSSTDASGRRSVWASLSTSAVVLARSA